MIFKTITKRIAGSLLGIFILVGCSNETLPTSGRLTVAAKASYSNSKTITSASNVSVSDFLLNLKEFELEVDNDENENNENEINNEQSGDNEDWNDDGYYDFEDDLELEGPFELDVLLGEISFLSVEVPNGRFEEIEFKFDKSSNEASELFGKSVLIKGTIDTVPFIFWHDFEDEIELDFDEPQFDVVIQSTSNDLTINFDLSQILDAVNGVDLSLATDLNGDGIIEISPIDSDGNTELAQELKEAIKKNIDLLDD